MSIHSPAATDSQRIRKRIRNGFTPRRPALFEPAGFFTAGFRQGCPARLLSQTRNGPSRGRALQQSVSTCPNQPGSTRSKTRLTAVIVLRRIEVPVIQESESVGDSERIAERGNKRLKRIGTHAHDVVGFQVNVRLLPGADLIQVHAGVNFAVGADT